jgi:hypothetical protein
MRRGYEEQIIQRVAKVTSQSVVKKLSLVSRDLCAALYVCRGDENE